MAILTMSATAKGAVSNTFQQSPSLNVVNCTMLGWLPRPLIVAFRSLTKSGMVAFDAPPAPQHECSVRERRGGRRAARGCWSRGSGPRRRRHRTSAPYPGRRPRPACPRGSTSCPDATPGFGTGEQQPRPNPPGSSPTAQTAPGLPPTPLPRRKSGAPLRVDLLVEADHVEPEHGHRRDVVREGLVSGRRVLSVRPPVGARVGGSPVGGRGAPATPVRAAGRLRGVRGAA